jgi:hypothetical protein
LSGMKLSGVKLSSVKLSRKQQESFPALCHEGV